MRLTPDQRDKLYQVADWVETTREIGFNMNYDLFSPTDGSDPLDAILSEDHRAPGLDLDAIAKENIPPGCGTVGCVAGTIAWRIGKTNSSDLFYAAADWLGMTKEETDPLFYPDGAVDIPWDLITRSQAARVIRDWADRGEGEPDWELIHE